VINYKTTQWETALRGRMLDAFVDCVGGYDAWVAAKLTLRHEGHYATLTGDTAGQRLTVGSVLVDLATSATRYTRSFMGDPSYHSFRRSVS
jgi:hypothetical protein